VASKNALGICDRSGAKTKLSNLVPDGYTKGLKVLPEWRDTAHPQERPVRTKERIAVTDPSPDTDDDGGGGTCNIASELFATGTYFGGGT
jgi:hypothetical protein